MTGESLPYLLRADWMITLLLFLCLVLVSYVFSNGRKHLLSQLKGFVTNRDRNSLFDEVTTEDIRYTFLLIFHTCVLLGLCIYNYFANTQPELFQIYPHYVLLAVFVGCMVALFLIKCLVYSFVNWIFFDKVRNTVWMTSFYNVTIWSGFLLLPVILLIVYFDLSFQSSLYLIGCVLVFVKITLFFKCFRNFFNNFYGSFHLILYLCTLEILPDILLWKSIVSVNKLFIQY
ncbi:MAG: DUF4271 domain-containing protein [Bacteroidaceae bacterium]|nr:DUF4271 domain-containing protein [Bacteroidaceae bacterium]